MASILRVTTTIDVSSDILNKDAGQLVKEAIQQAIPVVINALKKGVEDDQKK